MCQACTKIKPQELKSSRTEIYLKLITDVVSVSRKKTFWFFTGGRVCVKSQHRIYVPKTSKDACVKESKHLYLFSQCFGNFHSCFQIKSSDYCDDVSVKLKYLNAEDHICNPVLFVISLDGSHVGSRESTPISHQNSQNSKETVVDISILLGFSVLYCHMVQPSSIFVTTSIFNCRSFLPVFLKILILDCVVLPHSVMVHYV